MNYRRYVWVVGWGAKPPRRRANSGTDSLGVIQEDGRQGRTRAPVCRQLERRTTLDRARARTPSYMAKSDSFFVRSLVVAGTTADETEIDLGAFVDVQDKTVLRIHNIAVQYTDAGGNLLDDITATAATNASCRWQLTTQSQGTSLVTADDRSVISTGALTIYNANSASQAGAVAFGHSIDVGPQSWRAGYLVATESIYLLGERETNMASGDINVAIVLECSTETMGTSQAMALAMSQQ